MGDGDAPAEVFRRRRQWYRFEGRRHHSMLPVTAGTRYRIVAFVREGQDAINAQALPTSLGEAPSFLLLVGLGCLHGPGEWRHRPECRYAGV